LTESLSDLLDRKPSLVLYQAGVDSWEGDILGGLDLSEDGLAERDRIVFDACFQRNIPVAVTLGGGYSEELDRTASMHARTLRTAVERHKGIWHG